MPIFSLLLGTPDSLSVCGGAHALAPLWCGLRVTGCRQWVALTDTMKLFLNFSPKNGWFIARLVRASTPGPGGYQPHHCLPAKQTSCTGQCRGAHPCTPGSQLCVLDKGPPALAGAKQRCRAGGQGAHVATGGSVDAPSLPPPSDFAGHLVARP